MHKISILNERNFKTTSFKYEMPDKQAKPVKSAKVT
jgi:hypothetical protein